MGVPTFYTFVNIQPSIQVDYHNVPKFLDRQVSANSEDPNQTAPREAVGSGYTLFANLSALFRHFTQWKIHISQILGWLPQFF